MNCNLTPMEPIMRTKAFKLLLSTCLLTTQLLTLSSAFARSGGSMDGGGGDAYEVRVSDIRADILGWINKGGPEGLKLKAVGQTEYSLKMNEILQPKKVVVSFDNVEDSREACNGFISKVDSRPHVLCDIEKFKILSESKQYEVVHHSYADLAGIERSEDDSISKQIPEFLTVQSVLKLAVKKTPIEGDYSEPKIRISKNRYIGNNSFEFTLSAINTQNVAQIVLDGADKPTRPGESIRDCVTPMGKVVLEEGSFEKTFILKHNNKCSEKSIYVSFGDVSVEYTDGTIRPIKYQQFFYGFKDTLTHTNSVQVTRVIDSEKRERFIPEYFKKDVGRITRVTRFVYQTDAQSMSNYKGVQFSDGTEFLSDDANKLAEAINNKELQVKVVYEEEYNSVDCFYYYNFINPFCFGHGPKEIVRAGKYKLMSWNFHAAQISLIKKTEIAEVDTFEREVLEGLMAF